MRVEQEEKKDKEQNMRRSASVYGDNRSVACRDLFSGPFALFQIHSFFVRTSKF